ncbi:complement regulatory protein [Cricetid gammaherpesvirus 2]|uniref:Complement regulatory protein n=1 Tax=Cricetid gammaherpesvirus 2 TaxID=1605972 RepID=E9M5I6_9GAMA|nr:complement regulatory protein [Cricetid gammaherpesvirus 2]ADW24344.1 complement regulatory protein [Cricetid gammaherpesvirus 2]ADW24426.1 complement regulatory protein [Cricetid gammaherpesvirus 2]
MMAALVVCAILLGAGIFASSSPTCSTLPELSTVMTSGNPGTFPVPKGKEIKLKCAPGYKRVVARMNITCLGNDQWSDPPRCTRRECQGLQELNHGSFEYEIPDGGSRPTFGTKVTFLCNSGYSLVGEREQFCQLVDSKNVGWSGDPPMCRKKQCAPPRIPEDAYILAGEKDVYDHLDSISLGCKNGKKLFGAAQASCQEGAWIPSSLGPCVKTACAFPKAENGYFTLLSPQPDPNKVTIRLTCNNDSALLGPDTITCNNKKWSANPMCALIHFPTGRDVLFKNHTSTTLATYTTPQIFTLKTTENQDEDEWDTTPPEEDGDLTPPEDDNHKQTELPIDHPTRVPPGHSTAIPPRQVPITPVIVVPLALIGLALFGCVVAKCCK